MNKTVLVAVADGTEELEAVTIIDVLRRAEIDVTVASIQNLQVICSRGVTLVADKTIDQCMDQTYDLIAIPGGLPGADNLRDSEKLIELLKKQRKEERYYAAICASPAVVFQSHGLLEQKKATCYPAFIDHLTDRSASQSRVVVDGYCVTSQAPGTAMEFSLKLVELLTGIEKAREVAGAMIISYDEPL